ncbi:hypothetical protein AFCDBAGC_0089 [Methylobacterium cerastii]|uniref:Uncharacterized protein n=1 Tax=Methylobacterium cerastii TaxID=932741 RepID=A0ABQ4QAK9_9HYPH|nr:MULTISPECIES: hypothetical protein [Methylobacterium]TXM65397.1 hypothetical protein FV229_15615 [Methylobacterium sp. WL120]GJD42254.1 hypothetical protein AFCDBAGC_0089 [Methylobacterium cerastii]
MSIVQEFYSIAGTVLKDQRRVPSIRVEAVEPTPAGPRVRWTGGPYGPRVVATEDGTRWRGGVGPQVLLEGISRYLAVRWRERTPTVPTNWSEVLAARHPAVFTSGGPYTCPGWASLWAAGAEWIEEVGVPPGFATDDAKAKFGTLRWHHHADDWSDDVADVVEAIETISDGICEACGAPGRTRFRPWIETLCHTHNTEPR